MGTLRAHAGLAFPSSPLTAGAGQRSECSVFTFEQVTLTACVEPRTRVRGLEVRARGREVRGVLRRQRPSHRRVFPRRPRFDLVSPISVSAASQFLLERKKLVLRQLRAGAAQRSYRCCFFFYFSEGRMLFCNAAATFVPLSNKSRAFHREFSLESKTNTLGSCATRAARCVIVACGLNSRR